jgi:hypothetical protein
VGLKRKEKKKFAGSDDRNNSCSLIPLNPESLPRVWSEILTQMGPILARELDRGGLPAISGPNHLVLQFPDEYNAQHEYCSDPGRLQRIQDTLKRVTGQDWAVRLETVRGSNGRPRPLAVTAPTVAQAPAALDHPLIQRALEVLDAKLLQVEEGFGMAAPAPDEADGNMPDPEES